MLHFYVSGGTPEGRIKSYWQFDPELKTFISVGNGQFFELSPDGNWIVWVDGDDRTLSHQIHLYDIGNNKDYKLTERNSDCSFFQWAKVENLK